MIISCFFLVVATAISGKVFSHAAKVLINAESSASGDNDEFGGITLPPLPYAYNALKPHLGEETLRIHHDKHHAKV